MYYRTQLSLHKSMSVNGDSNFLVCYTHKTVEIHKKMLKGILKLSWKFVPKASWIYGY